LKANEIVAGRSAYLEEKKKVQMGRWALMRAVSVLMGGEESPKGGRKMAKQLKTNGGKNLHHT